MSGEKTFALGDRIEIWCRYCRLNLDAVVSATQNGQIAKVQCRTCRHFQDYKAPVPADVQRRKMLDKAMRLADRRTGSSRAPARKGAAAPDLSPEAVMKAIWDEATRDANPLKSKFYDRHRKLAANDLVTHSTHGLGVVREVHDEDGTVTILFREGFQRLEHDRPGEDDE